MSNNFKELTSTEAQELNGGAVFDRLKDFITDNITEPGKSFGEKWNNFWMKEGVRAYDLLHK
jgi:hypothetical protein